MFYGILYGENAVMLTDSAHGKPIIDYPQGDEIGGYHYEDYWIDDGQNIIHSYKLVPNAGTAEEASLTLSRMMFASLSDGQAYEVRGLAPDWNSGVTYYGPDDPSGNPQSRVIFKGLFWKCLTTHAAQANWAPDVAPSLWAEILPGQAGSGTEIGEWVPPGSTNGYANGDKVIYNGHLWESTVDNNVWKPGDVGAPWTDLGEYSPEA